MKENKKLKIEKLKLVKVIQTQKNKIDELEEDDFRDAKSIIELLKENLTLWKEEEEGGEGQEIDDL